MEISGRIFLRDLTEKEPGGGAASKSQRNDKKGEAGGRDPIVQQIFGHLVRH